MTASKNAVCAAQGFRAAGVACGLKAKDRPDLALVVSDRPAAAAGLLTTNLVCGAPVIVTRRHLADGQARAIVANAGNSNACTGAHGEADAMAMCRAVADGIGAAASDVLVASTGVIGRPLPMEKIRAGIAKALAEASAEGGSLAASAIMTTDTVLKEAVRRIHLQGRTVAIGGMAKGAGMIAPCLATMLAFVTTDAAISAADLRPLLLRAADASFNRLTVDGDTSTSDMLLALANGASGIAPLQPGTPDYEAFGSALCEVCRELAQMIARDGEGATKFVTVRVSGAPNERDAHQAARTVAESPLVKTALFGGDPNWGRIAAALGRSGVVFDPDRLSIRVDDLLLFERGMPAEFSLKEAERRFREKVITIHADLGAGDAETEVYTCDMSYDYVKINAEYTT